MMTRFIAQIMLRELASLRAEIEAYDEADLWSVPDGISNSAGTLALHLCGNLQHYVGAKLGGSAYVRDRDAEFARRNVSCAELFDQVTAAEAAVQTTFAKLGDADLAAKFPEEVMGRTVTTGNFLVHLVSHLAYHLGQIDYHRRLLARTGGAVSNLSIRHLESAQP